MDNAGNTSFTGAKTIPYLRIENLKNPTLSSGTYLYRPYMEVPPPPGPGGKTTHNLSYFFRLNTLKVSLRVRQSSSFEYGGHQSHLHPFRWTDQEFETETTFFCSFHKLKKLVNAVN